MSLTNYQIIGSYNKIIFQVYIAEGLECLADKSLKVEGDSVLTFCSKFIKLFNIQDISKNFNTLIEDIFNCSKDLKYCVGSLFLLKPYLSNPLRKPDKIGDIEMFSRNQNLFDKRYIMYSSMASEKLYNYWDRIGDLLNMILKVVVDEKKEYFHAVVAKIPDSLKSSNNYKWLSAFTDKEFKEINNIRRSVVHFRMLETANWAEHLNTLHNLEAMEKLQSDIESYTSFYKSHLKLTISGFEKAINLLTEFKNTLPEDVDLNRK